MATNAAPAATPAAAPAAPAADTFKVFVGNLSFKTREGELQKAFAPAGNVLSANIITRGPRSLGYGFVEFPNEDQAKKAVALMNKKELDGREINVEVAKNREEPTGSSSPAAGGDAASGEGFRGRGRGRPRGSAGGFIRRRGGAPTGGAPRSDNGGAPAPRTRGAFRGGRGGARPPRSASDADNRPPRAASSTTLFVANLPFSVDDKELLGIFAAYNPSGAHVVVKRNGRSKGFGFVEFKSAEDQGKALAALDKKDVSGRELIVKIALTEQQGAAGGESKAAASPAESKAAASPAEKKEEKKP